MSTFAESSIIVRRVFKLLLISMVDVLRQWHVWIVLVGLCPFASRAQSAVNDSVRVLLPESVYAADLMTTFYIDETDRNTASEALEQFRLGKSYHLPGTTANFTGIDGTIWCRILVNNRTRDSIYIHVPNIFVEHFDVFVVNGDSIKKGTSTGLAFPFSSRALPTCGYTLKVPVDPSLERFEILASFRTESRSPMILRIKLGNWRALLSEARTSEFLSIASLGILLVMFFYNFCLWVAIRDTIYIYYCAYIFSAVISVVWFNGFAFEWVTTSERINAQPWWMGVFYLGQLAFVNQLLKIRSRLPKLFPFCVALYLVSISLCFSVFLPSGLQLALALTGGILVPVYFLAASLVLAFRGVRMAYIFLLGWIPILIVTIFNILMIGGIVEYNPWFDTHLVEAAYSWEVVFFSLALGYRYSVVEQEKIQLQSENVRILGEQKNILRQAVLERTEEIMAQNEQLVKNQEQIKMQNERLEAQNRTSEKLREMILRQNQDLESAVRKRTLDLAQANEDLKTTIQKLERFSYITAHNLRGPVARILGLSSLIDKKNLASPENVIIVDRLHSSAKDLDVIIHDLGTILAIQHGKVDHFEVVDFGGVVKRVVENFAKEITDLDIQVELHSSVHSIDTIPSCLQSILANLISNSIKYKSDERQAIIKIHAAEAEDAVDIIVEDNGIGFDSKGYSDKIFEPFQRFHTHNQGKGLGLFLIKTQVSLLGGRVVLTGQVGRGVRVAINLPKRKFDVA